MATVANVHDRVLATTAPTVVARYTVQVDRSFAVHVYFRTTAPATVLLEAAWTDAGGPQSVILAGGTQEVGAHATTPLYVQAEAGTDLTVTAETDVPGAVFVSVTLKEQ